MKNYTITVNGTPYNVTVEEGTTAAPAVQAAPTAPVAPSAPAAAPAPTPVSAGSEGSIKVEAPMPGTILDVKTTVGASVENGQVLCILEAMKMENDIVAPKAGTVASISVNKGDSVEAGQVIITLN